MRLLDSSEINLVSGGAVCRCYLKESPSYFIENFDGKDGEACRKACCSRLKQGKSSFGYCFIASSEGGLYKVKKCADGSESRIHVIMSATHV